MTTITEILLPKLDSLSYLFTESAGKTVAHCLELDVVATGATVDIAEKRLDSLVKIQIRTAHATLSIADMNFHAPSEYFQAFYEGVEIKKAQLEIEVPRMVLPVSEKVQMLPVFMRKRSVA